MAGKRRRFTAEFKARVVRAAFREDKTLAALAGEFEVHPNQITEWTRQVLEAMPDLFGLAAGGRPMPSRPRRMRRGCTSRSASSRWNWSG